MVIDAINMPDRRAAGRLLPGQVPQQPGTAITLRGRDSRLLVANYDFGGQHLVYSTSELMTQATIGGRATALLYDPAGTDGETVLQLRQPAHGQGAVRFGARPPGTRAAGDLRLDYVHNGLAEVQITGGGAPPLLLLIADTDTAEEFWPEQTAAGPGAGPGRLPGAHRAPRTGRCSR